MASDGAKVIREERPTTIAGFGDLLAKLDAMAELYRAQLDAQHAQIREILQTVTTVTPQENRESLAKVEAALVKIAENTRPLTRPAYTLHVKRNEEGFIRTVHAVPETRH
jgi:hypothetical protein